MPGLSGRCNCGAIQVTIPTGCSHGLCHCTNCRRSSGSTFTGNFVVQNKDLEISGSPKVFKQKGSSGTELSRYFCGDCGSPIYAGTTPDAPAHVKAGLFDPGSIPAPVVELYCQNLESWEKVHEGAQRHERM